MKISRAFTRDIVHAALFLVAFPALLTAQETLRSYKAEIMAHAQPDEWWYSFYDEEVPGSGDNEYVKDGIDPNCVECLENGGLPKANQAYVWSMVLKDNYLWWGTGPNVSSIVISTYLDNQQANIARSRRRGINYSLAEYGLSKFVREGVYDGETLMGPPLPAAYGDWRPPDIFRYNLDTNTKERLDINLRTADPAAWALLWRTLGLRSGGFTAPTTAFPNGLVILAGPCLPALPGQEPEGVIMFAFDALTGDIVAAKNFPDYNNIRSWKHWDGQLYTTVSTYSGQGLVLRWNKQLASVANPLQFEPVGILDSAGAEIEVHDDGDGPRLYVTTWPNISEGEVTTQRILDAMSAPASLWRSMVIPSTGLNAIYQNGWTKVWSVADYETDLVLALAYGGGALASYEGYLYWGTMHVPGTAQLGHNLFYGTPDDPLPRPDPYPEDPEDPERVAYELDQERYDQEEELDSLLSYRAISIWRGRNFTNTGGDIDLLYGRANLPVRIPRTQFTQNASDPRSPINISWLPFFEQRIGDIRNVQDGESVPYGIFFPSSRVLVDGGDWEDNPNYSGYVPLYGPEGVFPKDYGFSSFPWNNYTWTMQVFGGKLFVGTMDWDDIRTPDDEDGADIFCFPSSSDPAVLVSGVGMANWSSYGVRTIAADDTRGELYLGMANVNNLLNKSMGDPVDGGWEIQRVTMRYPDEDFDELDDDWENEHFGSTEAVNDPNGNSDYDPLTHWEEWLAGTDPNDPNSWFFSVAGEAVSPGMHEIRWPAIPGRYYTVYESETLDGDWSPVANYEGIDGMMSHAFSLTGGKKFFKVTVFVDPPEDIPDP